jgi:hypothetical protein
VYENAFPPKYKKLAIFRLRKLVGFEDLTPVVIKKVCLLGYNAV